MRKIFEDFFDAEKLFVKGEISAEQLKIIQPHLMPENIKSAIVWLIPYYTGNHENRNVSLYAVSRDYHLYARELNSRLCALAKKHFPGEEFYGFCDSSPINEISAAITAGLGVLGKNRLLINERYGSYVFICCMLSTLPAESPVNNELKGCIGCARCVKMCKFLSGERAYCLSDLNQKKVVTDEELTAIKAEKTRWGCDICQEVCPMNKGIEQTPVDFFYKEQLEFITAELLENMPKDAFKKRAYSWRGKKTVLRNIEDDGNSSKNL